MRYFLFIIFALFTFTGCELEDRKDEIEVVIVEDSSGLDTKQLMEATLRTTQSIFFNDFKYERAIIYNAMYDEGLEYSTTHLYFVEFKFYEMIKIYIKEINDDILYFLENDSLSYSDINSELSYTKAQFIIHIDEEILTYYGFFNESELEPFEIHLKTIIDREYEVLFGYYY